MNTIIRQLSEENFKRTKNNIVKNYNHNLTQKDINELVIERVNQCKKAGYTDEQISQMTFTVNYYNHKNEK